MDKTKIKYPLIIIILTLGILLGTQIQKVFSTDGLFENLKKFNDVISLTQKYYLEEVEVDKMVENAINGMLAKLDPHSVYIPVKQMQTVEEEFRGDFEGNELSFRLLMIHLQLYLRLQVDQARHSEFWRATGLLKLMGRMP